MKGPQMTPTRIRQPEPPKDEVPVEIIADALVAISAGITKLRAGRLNDKALLMLIQHACPASDRPSISSIRTVLDAVESLRSEYVKKPAKA